MRPLRQKQWYKDLDDPDIKTWYNVNRLDSTGNGPRLPCSRDQDYKEYANKLKDFDNSFDSWMQNGGKQNG